MIICIKTTTIYITNREKYLPNLLQSLLSKMNNANWFAIVLGKINTYLIPQDFQAKISSKKCDFSF